MKCRYCRTNNASSKEHLVANRRLSQINSFKNPEEINDNVPKTFKKITCETCNNELGKYEDKSEFNLAHATIWKILAGNINNAFERYSQYTLNNSSIRTIAICEEQLFNTIQNSLILPNLTFTFSFDAQKSVFQNRFGEAVSKNIPKVFDINGNPLDDVTLYSKDSFPNNNDIGYFAKSNNYGEFDLSILTNFEKIIIVKENIQIFIDNIETRSDIDIIIYVTYNANNHRLILFYPLIGEIQNVKYNSIVEINFRDFLLILNSHIPEFAITELNEYFKKTSNIVNTIVDTDAKKE